MRTIILDSPVFYDKFIQNLNIELETLDWIQNQYPICRKCEVKEGSFPEVYYGSGSKKNLKVFPEGNSISFFTLGTITEIEDFHFNIELSLFIWADLTKVYPQKKYDYTAELEKAVIPILKNYSCNDLVIEHENVFKDFTMIEKSLQQNTMRPYTSFRVNFNTVITKC